MVTEGIDLCGGPGGWDVAARRLGWHVVGVEWDDAACATRRAAGLPTLQGDIAALSPVEVVRMLPSGRCRVLIASPPCTTFSMAGKGIGRLVLPQLAKALRDVALGARHSSIEDVRAPLIEFLVGVMAAQRAETLATLDERGAAGDAATAAKIRATDWTVSDREDAATTTLVLEPMRWLRDLEPELLAMEQVPPVLPLWDVFVRILRDDLGWRSAWTGTLNAADYGVPQTRTRAVVIASRYGVVQPPPATHCRGGSEPTLFGDGLLPWVSMAQALGWGMTARPSVTVQAAGGAGGGPRPLDGGAHAREAVQRERDEGRWEPPTVVTRGELKGDGGNEFSSDQPSWALTSSARSWLVNTGRDWKSGGTREDAQQFDAAEQPAPTVDATGRWFATPIEHVEIRRGGERIEEGFNPTEEPSQTITTRVNRWQLRSGSNDKATVRDQDEPAPTIAFGHDSSGVQWEQLDENPPTHFALGQMGNQPRPIGEPAPTITGEVGVWTSSPAEKYRGSRAGWRDRPSDDPTLDIEAPPWEPGTKVTLRTGHNSMKHSRDPQDMVPFERSIDEPAPTLDAKVGSAWKVAAEGEHVDPPMRWKERIPVIEVDGELDELPDQAQWTEDRPATTIAGDARVFQPGGHTANDGRDNSKMHGRSEGAIRITVQQAAVLQSFPADHPWQGSQTKQFEQVGNACPPLLSWYVLRALAGLEPEEVEPWPW